MKVIEHISLEALKAKEENKETVKSTNMSHSLTLTLSNDEVKELEKRFFVDIAPIIEDNLMAKLLEHFKYEGTLLYSDDLNRV